jgi:hypothetical protein
MKFFDDVRKMYAMCTQIAFIFLRTSKQNNDEYKIHYCSLLCPETKGFRR